MDTGGTGHRIGVRPSSGTVEAEISGADVASGIDDEQFSNPDFTVRCEGWTEAESRPRLEYRYRHGSRPEFTCRFRWRRGSLAFRDNRATWHYALNDYPGQRRHLHRITIEGAPLGG